jgi:hypothetical protein
MMNGSKIYPPEGAQTGVVAHWATHHLLRTDDANKHFATANARTKNAQCGLSVGLQVCAYCA